MDEKNNVGEIEKKNETCRSIRLVEENEGRLHERKADESSNTGHTEMVQNSEGIDMLDKSKDIESAEKSQLEATFMKAGVYGSLHEDGTMSAGCSQKPKAVGFEASLKRSLLSENETHRADDLSQKILQKLEDLSNMQSENLNNNILYYTHKNKVKKHEMQREWVLNARNTIILIALLIATVTFAAGITPPGGVYQDGGHEREVNHGGIDSFQGLHMVVLVSVIPFTRKCQMKFVGVALKVMWVAVGFMGTGYVAAIWVILPHGGSEGYDGWVSVLVIAVGGGFLGTIFVGLGVMFIKHSQNSDVESACSKDYHSY
ncbi:ankyrin repeat-containing protein [Senna tora]|uniref:Ankyrin repeat-containing protein n=1 Tax=Senna tora TaxID=362788 RepID=A0A834X1H7_9FABA|nr:ankyrin repeat-containing protein [Senna tora]